MEKIILIILMIILNYFVGYVYILLGRLSIIIVKKISNFLKYDLLETVKFFEHEPLIWEACWIIFFPIWILALISYLIYFSALFIEDKIVSFIQGDKIGRI